MIAHAFRTRWVLRCDVPLVDFAYDDAMDLIRANDLISHAELNIPDILPLSNEIDLTISSLIEAISIEPDSPRRIIMTSLECRARTLRDRWQSHGLN